MARPSRVRRNRHKNSTTSATAISITNRVDWPAKGVFFSKPLAMVNTVVVLFMLRVALLPLSAMFTEYSAVLTTMPASRLCTPMRICSVAVTKPDTMPASIAAGMDSQGYPASATSAPTTAPRVKQPSVLRSHTFSME